MPLVGLLNRSVAGFGNQELNGVYLNFNKYIKGIIISLITFFHSSFGILCMPLHVCCFVGTMTMILYDVCYVS